MFPLDDVIMNVLKGPVTPFRAGYAGFLRAWIFQHAEKVLRANRYFASFACTSRVGCEVPECLLRVFYVACVPHPEMARESCVLETDNIRALRGTGVCTGW